METVEKAIMLFDEHQYEDALSLIQQSKAAGEASFDLCFYQGKILQKMGKYGDAINCYQEAKEISPEDPRPEVEIMMISNILSITNNFFYENAYTDMECIDYL